MHRRVIWNFGLLLPLALTLLYGQAQAPKIGMKEFRKLWAENRAVVLDVRSPESYREGHIPGAISIPLKDLPGRAAELRKAGRPIIAYCA